MELKRICTVVTLSSLLLGTAYSSTFAAASSDDLAIDALMEMSLEELSELPITILRQKQDTFTTPSSIYIITQEDIKRSSATTIAGLLRLVPGFHVGQTSGSRWSVNARGPNQPFSHEMLVLLDGRSVYTPLFNGVYWNRVDTLLDDIDRIEVIRGSGGSLWGSNAANGIVNIVTKNAADSKGGLGYLELGSGQYNQGYGGRYGVQVADSGYLRFYGKHRKLVSGEVPELDEQSGKASLVPGESSHDAGDHTQGGFRGDWNLAGKSFTFQGDIYSGDEGIVKIGSITRSATQDTVSYEGGNLLARLSSGKDVKNEWSGQIYFDYESHENSTFKDSRVSADIDFQQSIGVAGQEIIWGAGYRLIDNSSTNSSRMFGFALDPADTTDHLFSLFIQDSISFFANRLNLVAGIKYEHNDYTGSEWQPSVKASYTPAEEHNVWASLTRAVTVPSLANTSGYLDLSAFDGATCAMVGGSMDPRLGCVLRVAEEDPDANVLVSSEIGYRFHRGEWFNMEHALFYNKYPHQNSESDRIDYMFGYEGVVRFNILENWNLEASYTFHDPKEDKKYRDTIEMSKHSVKARSYLDLPWNTSFDLFYYYESAAQNFPAYHKLDIHFSYKPIDQLDFSLLFSNVLGDHVEMLTDSQRGNSVQEPSVLFKVTGRF